MRRIKIFEARQGPADKDYAYTDLDRVRTCVGEGKIEDKDGTTHYIIAALASLAAGLLLVHALL